MVTTRASISRALCIGITMTALIGPVLAAYDDAVRRNYDSDPGFLVLPYAIIGLLLFATFAPAMIVAVGHAPTARHVWLATAVVLACLGGAHLGRALLDHPAEILVFPAAGVAAVFAARRVTGLPTPAPRVSPRRAS